jgi:hypothetical protein
MTELSDSNGVWDSTYWCWSNNTMSYTFFLLNIVLDCASLVGYNTDSYDCMIKSSSCAITTGHVWRRPSSRFEYDPEMGSRRSEATSWAQHALAIDWTVCEVSWARDPLAADATAVGMAKVQLCMAFTFFLYRVSSVVLPALISNIPGCTGINTPVQDIESMSNR